MLVVSRRLGLTWRFACSFSLTVSLLRQNMPLSFVLS